MHSLLRFLEILGALVALPVGAVLLVLWALSIDDNPNYQRITSSLIWSAFWPLVWLYRWVTGKKSSPAPGQILHSAASPSASQVGGREQSMARFRTIREAKDYLAGVIAEEAERDGTPLTEVERKMLYFSETGWTLPDMRQVSSEFDRDYDQDIYEQKIALIIRRIETGFTDECREEQLRWGQAFEKLGEGDHYLLILDEVANRAQKGPRHNLKLLIIALAFLALAAFSAWFGDWMRDH